MLVVSSILLAVNYFTGKLFTIETLASFAVIFGFAHTQVSFRLLEQEANKQKPSIECYWKMFFLHNGNTSLVVEIEDWMPVNYDTFKEDCKIMIKRLLNLKVFI